MLVQHVHDALRVHLTAPQDVAFVLLVLRRNGGKVAQYLRSDIVVPLLHRQGLRLNGVDDVLLSELALIAHLHDVLLRGAATVF